MGQGAFPFPDNKLFIIPPQGIPGDFTSMEQTVSIQDFREMKVAEGSIRFEKGQDLDDKGDFTARKEKARSLLA